MTYEVLKSNEYFNGKAFSVRVDQVQAPNGHVMNVEVVVHTGAVVIVPMDDDGHILFVKQYRHPTGKVLLELPAGTREPDEDSVTCAIRECREETGLAPGKITRVGGFFLAPGYSTEYLDIFMAQDLKPFPLDPDEDEDLEVVRLNFQESRESIKSGLIEDAKTIASLYFIAESLVG